MKAFLKRGYKEFKSPSQIETLFNLRFESDNEESEEEEKILDKHEKPEPLSAFIHSTRSIYKSKHLLMLLSNTNLYIFMYLEKCSSFSMLWR